MTAQNTMLTDTELDSALDTLMAPAPSDILVRRVQAMAPHPAVSVRRRRYGAAIAAVLVIAIAGAITVEIMTSSNHPMGHMLGPSSDITTQDIDLVDPVVPMRRTDNVSVAALPLE